MQIWKYCTFAYIVIKGMKLITIFFFLLHLLVLNDFMMRAKTLERLEEYRVIQKYAHEREQDIQLLHKHREERKMVTLLSHFLIEIKSFKAEISDFVTYTSCCALEWIFFYKSLNWAFAVSDDAKRLLETLPVKNMNCVC